MGVRDRVIGRSGDLVIGAALPAALELHIEELVLHGFAPADRFRIGDAVERELTRLLAEKGMHGIGRNSVVVEKLDGGSFKVVPGARPHMIGGQVAQAVHQQLSPARKQVLPGRGTKANSGVR